MIRNQNTDPSKETGVTRSQMSRRLTSILLLGNAVNQNTLSLNSHMHLNETFEISCRNHTTVLDRTTDRVSSTRVMYKQPNDTARINRYGRNKRDVVLERQTD